MYSFFRLLSGDGETETLFRFFHPRATPLFHLFQDGDEGTRTPDLLLAKEALSRLSYIPKSY